MNQFDPAQLWKMIWEQKMLHIILFSLFLAAITGIFLFKNFLAKKRSLVAVIRYTVLIISFIYVGLFLKAQPTTANIVILTTALKENQFPINLFMLEPYIFLSFSFIFVTMFVWGRGVFCGWLCPYGAMLELCNKAFSKVFPKFRFRVPEKVEKKLRYIKYGIFTFIIAVTFYNFLLAEVLTEVEPFRTFVLKLDREWYFIVYFAVLTIGSVLVYRAFCRYLCPLGAAVAIPALLKRIPFLKMKRHDFCTKCKICARECPPSAINDEGIISSSECLGCLDCQINYWDEHKCPALKQHGVRKEGA